MLRLIAALVACAFALPAYAEPAVPSPEEVIDRALAHEENPTSPEKKPEKKTVRKVFKKHAVKTGKKKETESSKASKKSGPERAMPPDLSKL